MLVLELSVWQDELLLRSHCMLTSNYDYMYSEYMYDRLL